MVTFSSNTVTINLDYDLFPGTDFYVLVDAGAIKDLAGHSFAGITSPTALNFTTAGEPPSGGSAGAYAEATGVFQEPTAIGPWLDSLAPEDESTVRADTNFVLTFDKDVKAGSGSLEIRDSTEDRWSRALLFPTRARCRSPATPSPSIRPPIWRLVPPMTSRWPQA